MAKTQQMPATAGIPAHLAAQIEADAGKGLSSLQEDNIVPLIYILQSLSPQVLERNPDYIPGAKPGDIWLRNAPQPIIKGEEGFLFQPCYFFKDWVEWMPERGGFAGRHEHKPQDAVETPDPKDPSRMQWTRPNGNILSATRYHVGLAYIDGTPLPYVIPMASSGHTTSRQFMFTMNAKVVNGKVAPSWSCLYRMKTKFVSKKKGDWFMWDIQDAGWVPSMEYYQRGADLNTAFSSGEKVVETAEHESSELGSDDM